jgi:hypothetical protein
MSLFEVSAEDSARSVSETLAMRLDASHYVEPIKATPRSLSSYSDLAFLGSDAATALKEFRTDGQTWLWCREKTISRPKWRGSRCPIPPKSKFRELMQLSCRAAQTRHWTSLPISITAPNPSWFVRPFSAKSRREALMPRGGRRPGSRMDAAPRQQEIPSTRVEAGKQIALVV